MSASASAHNVWAKTGHHSQAVAISSLAMHRAVGQGYPLVQASALGVSQGALLQSDCKTLLVPLSFTIKFLSNCVRALSPARR